jgi:hypothetical protein
MNVKRLKIRLIALTLISIASALLVSFSLPPAFKEARPIVLAFIALVFLAGVIAIAVSELIEDCS